MNKIYNNLNVENLIKTNSFKQLDIKEKEDLLTSSQWFNQFNKSQKRYILEGVYCDLDISIYAKSDFDWMQMNEIRLGLQDGLDVSVYAKPEIDCGQMKKIRLKLLKKD